MELYGTIIPPPEIIPVVRRERPAMDAQPAAAEPAIGVIVRGHVEAVESFLVVNVKEARLRVVLVSQVPRRAPPIPHINAQLVLRLVGQVVDFFVAQPELVVEVAEAVPVVGPVAEEV